MTLRRFGVSAIVTAIVLMLVVLSALSLNTPTSQAAPLAAPTPISVPIQARVVPEFPTFFNTTVLQASANSSAFEVPDYSAIDLQWIIDVNTVNTTTLKLQYSNDNVNFVDGASFASAVVADANSMQQYPLFGRWTRVVATVSNTDPITITVMGTVK